MRPKPNFQRAAKPATRRLNASFCAAYGLLSSRLLRFYTQRVPSSVLLINRVRVSARVDANALFYFFFLLRFTPLFRWRVRVERDGCLSCVFVFALAADTRRSDSLLLLLLRRRRRTWPLWRYISEIPYYFFFVFRRDESAHVFHIIIFSLYILLLNIY